jgi:hypothetical protein
MRAGGGKARGRAGIGAVAAAALAVSGLASAAGGALPKGKKPPPGAAGEVSGPAPGASTGGKSACALGLWDPPGESMVFTPDGRNVYLLASQAPPGAKDPAAAGRKLALFRAGIEKAGKAEAIAAVEYHAESALIGEGEPLSRVVILRFTGPTAACFEGPVTARSVDLVAKKAEKPALAVSKIHLVAGPHKPLLFDIEKSRVLNVDAATGQAKTYQKVDKNERALFYDPSDDLLVTWHDDGKKRGLVRRLAGKIKRLAFKGDDRYLQDRSRFLALAVDKAANTLTINEVPVWSGEGAMGRYAVALTSPMDAANAAVLVNTESKVAVIFGRDFLAKQRWQKLLIVNYAKGSELAVVTAPKGQYVHATGIDPTGRRVVMELRDVKTRSSKGLKVFDVQTGSFVDVSMAAPK